MVSTAEAHTIEPSTGTTVAAQLPLAVYSCGRLGRVANPPSFSLTDWLLPGRRR